MNDKDLGLQYRELNNGNIAIMGPGSFEGKVLIIPDEIDGKIVSAIDDCAFRYNSDITSVRLASTITHVGQCAFDSCKNLRYLFIPSTLYFVKTHAFNCCNKLEMISFGRIGQLNWFAEDIFYGCNNIKDIKIERR